MGRGIIYHIGLASKIEDYDMMDESHFYSRLEALDIDYITNQASHEAKESIARLVSRLRAAGFKVELSMDPHYESFYFFNTGDEDELTVCKSGYFAAAFTSLQKMVNSMSLETFASDGQEEFTLRNLINNKIGDAVYFGEMYEDVYSLDSFIRKLSPNKSYYIAPDTIYMH